MGPAALPQGPGRRALRGRRPGRGRVAPRAAPLPPAAPAGARGRPPRLPRPLPPAPPHAAPALPAGPAAARSAPSRRPRPAAARTDAASDQAEYEAALARVLRSVRANDRRHGPARTCSGWPTPATWPSACASWRPRTRPCASSSTRCTRCSRRFYRRLDQRRRRAVEQADARAGGVPGRARRRTASLVDALLEDGFAFTELHHRGPGLQPVPGRQQALPAVAPTSSSRSTPSWCARRSGACARATAACSRAWRATCPASPSEQCQTPGRRGQGHDEHAGADLPVRRRLADGRQAAWPRRASRRRRSAASPRRSWTCSWTWSRASSGSRSSATCATASRCCAPSTTTGRSRTRRAAASASTSSATPRRS